MKNIPKYVFRGTTINYEGGSSSQKCEYTCTTKHPVIAALFALLCAQEYPEQSVVYIFKTIKLKSLKPMGNVLKKHEEELAWPVLPKDMLELSEGYVDILDMKKVLNDFQVIVDPIVSVDNLTRLCKEATSMSDTEIETIVKALEALIKKS